jgi:two-component system osmolarity sensor histidine kinase EnvZ
LRRDLPPLRDPWGGYWIKLQSRGWSGPIWLYQPERLSTNVWFLPVLRVLTLLFGALLGIIVFLNQRVERPFRTVLEQLPDTFMPPLALLPAQGIAPLRQLTRRINRLLERINSADRSRRQLLRGLAHDLTSPQARLMLKLEWLRDTLPGEAGRQLDGVENDLQQLAHITGELVLLAEQDAPRPQHSQVLLDDLCARVATSYAAGTVELEVPQLLVSLDPISLERVLSNLIDNGMEHGRAPVRIRAGRNGGRLQLQIDDHGAGLSSPTRLTMPAPPLARDRQRSRHRGLGLAIVEAFCHDHGGQLQLGTSELGGLQVRLDLAGSTNQPIFPPTAPGEAKGVHHALPPPRSRGQVSPKLRRWLQP